ncbi:hypothetical protein FB567DRAFT_630623 [Paraphoma chrysanthemicola]|uniref:DUF6536 domain-containing protein n=1 Tax=Paraphoma chrysanthemicola TaxID=798071 RepID=A0A8K0VVY6_9PLEO|nr:hypothetical protein FB567DRAFT_630623 [Paraphoma chrysanthemicola]
MLDGFNFWRTRRRTALIAACVAAGLTLSLNISAIIYLQLRSVPNPGGEMPINPRLFLGNCSKALRLNTGIHVLINILSTIMLACSNMFMQLLLAPTRAEIDRAHRRQRFLDIGVPSLRNLLHISTRNRLVWAVLVLSSLPLHLLYNSAVYMTRPMNDINLYVVTPGFLEGETASVRNGVWMYNWRRQQNLTGLDGRKARDRKIVSQQIEGDGRFGWYGGCTTDNCSSVQQYAMQRGYSRVMSPLECLNAYSTFEGNRSDVIFVSSYDYLWNSSTAIPHFALNGSEVLITEDASKLPNRINSSLLFALELPSMFSAMGFWIDYGWLCGNTNSFECRRPSLWREDPSIIKDWNMLGWKVDECLVRDVPLTDKCSVNYSTGIIIVVCCVNALKFICMLYGVRLLSKDGQYSKPLSTIGDAIASFLEIRDGTTCGLALINKATLSRQNSAWSAKRKDVWTADRFRWFQLVSKKRLSWTLLMSMVVLFGGISAMLASFVLIKQRAGTARHILDIPFGATDQYTFGQLGRHIAIGDRDSTRKAFFPLIFFANIYASKRKALRVSSPKGEQRSTYFLSLPWRYGIPLAATSALLHWTLSQSIFLTALATYRPEGFNNELLFLGSSPRPLILTVTLGFIIGIVLLGLCFRKSKGVLPRGGTCSAIISAACHGPAGDTEAAFKPFKWGEIDAAQSSGLLPRKGHIQDINEAKHAQSTGVDIELTELAGLGHCCFTTYDVTAPVQGREYC